MTAFPEECFCIQHFQICSILYVWKHAYDEAYSILEIGPMPKSMYKCMHTYIRILHLIRWAKSFACDVVSVNIFAQHIYVNVYIWMQMHMMWPKTSAVKHVTWFYMNLRNAQNWDSKSERTNTHIYTVEFGSLVRVYTMCILHKGKTDIFIDLD